jgi:hypothetical protein
LVPTGIFYCRGNVQITNIYFTEFFFVYGIHCKPQKKFEKCSSISIVKNP